MINYFNAVSAKRNGHSKNFPKIEEEKENKDSPTVFSLRKFSRISGEKCCIQYLSFVPVHNCKSKKIIVDMQNIPKCSFHWVVSVFLI